MFKKDLYFKSIVLKVFFAYLVVYLLALIFKYNYDFEFLLNNIKYKYLIVLNLISIFLGLPLSIVFDFILIKFFGLKYIMFFAPILTTLGLAQILLMRKANFRISTINPFIKGINNHRLKHIFKNISIKPIFVLIIRTFPILPFSVGSYFIASSEINKRLIICYSFIGAYFYYFSLLFIIQSA